MLTQISSLLECNPARPRLMASLSDTTLTGLHNVTPAGITDAQTDSITAGRWKSGSAGICQSRVNADARLHGLMRAGLKHVSRLALKNNDDSS